MGIDYYNNQQNEYTTTVYMHDVHRAFYLLHFRHYNYCCDNRVFVVFLTLTHRYNAVRGHRTGSNNLYSSSVQYEKNIMRLFLDETHARGAQVRYVTRTWLFGEESDSTTGRWAFGCSHTVMVNI